MSFSAYLAVFMLGQGVIALFDLDSWIAVMELVSNQLRLLWQHLIGGSQIIYLFLPQAYIGQSLTSSSFGSRNRSSHR